MAILFTHQISLSKYFPFGYKILGTKCSSNAIALKNNETKCMVKTKKYA